MHYVLRYGYLDVGICGSLFQLYRALPVAKTLGLRFAIISKMPGACRLILNILQSKQSTASHVSMHAAVLRLEVRVNRLANHVTVK